MLPLDARLLFAARIVRLFAYGFVAVVLVLYLSAIGLDDHRIGLLLSLTLAGDVVVSLYLTTRADALGRKRTLLAGAMLMIGAAVVFAIRCGEVAIPAAFVVSVTSVVPPAKLAPAAATAPALPVPAAPSPKGSTVASTSAGAAR